MAEWVLTTSAQCSKWRQSVKDDIPWDFNAEILDNNSIDKAVFEETVTQALSNVWKKGNSSIMLISPANCDKTFIMLALIKTLKSFVSPVSGTSAWIRAQKAEQIFLNDLSWN